MNPPALAYLIKESETSLVRGIVKHAEGRQCFADDDDQAIQRFALAGVDHAEDDQQADQLRRQGDPKGRRAPTVLGGVLNLRHKDSPFLQVDADVFPLLVGVKVDLLLVAVVGDLVVHAVAYGGGQ